MLTSTVAPRLGLNVDPEAVNSVTRGLVGDTSFAVLPDVVPLTCFLLTLGAQIVSSSFPLVVSDANMYSLSFFDYSTNQRGRPLLVRLRFVDTLLFSLVGMYTRKRSSW
jgi:hypothetical protein